MNEKTQKKNHLIAEGHRGYRPKENSLEGFQIAFEMGVDGIETDIWLTNDNVLFINHGHTELGLLHLIEIESSKPKLIHAKDLSKSDIEKYIEYSTKKPLLLLETLLNLAKKYPKIYLNIEFKDHSEKAMEVMGNLLTKMKPKNKIYFSSFNHVVKEKLLKVSEKIPYLKKISFGFCCHNLVILENMKSLPGIF